MRSRLSSKGQKNLLTEEQYILLPPVPLLLSTPEKSTRDAQLMRQVGRTEFYIPQPASFNKLLQKLLGDNKKFPTFPFLLIQDKHLARLILRLHIALEGLTSQLEQDSRLLWTLAKLIARHADSRPQLKSVGVGTESQSIRRVRDYLEAHYAKNVSLEHLASIANLSPFYFIRTFRNQVGLPPHGYLNQVRLVHAKMLLLQGEQISQVAYQTGFADQICCNFGDDC